MNGALNAVTTIVAGLGQLVGIRAGTEMPAYSVVEHFGDVEIRRYGPRLAAEAEATGEAEAARSQAFRKVAGYIFGGNTSKTSIAMTAPVAQAAKGGQTIAMTAPVAQSAAGNRVWRLQFFMPASYRLETLPVPSDPDVRIVEVPARDYAVLRFSGSRSGQAVERRAQALLSAVGASRWRAEGAPVGWFYDPPWTPPFLRRNEVSVAVASR